MHVKPSQPVRMFIFKVIYYVSVFYGILWKILETETKKTNSSTCAIWREGIGIDSIDFMDLIGNFKILLVGGVKIDKC